MQVWGIKNSLSSFSFYEAIKKNEYPGVYVLCKIRFKNGNIKK